MLYGMRFREGFTLVELIITMVAMTILMALGTVAVTQMQAQARDKERQADVEAIARGLEARYTNGNNVVEAFPSGYTNKGMYPGMNEFLHAMGCERSDFTPADPATGYLTDFLPGTTPQSLTAPGRETFSQWAGVNSSCDPATYNTIDFLCVWACPSDYNFSDPNADTRISSAVTTDKYTYASIETNTGQICCCGNCRSFYLYYRSEVDDQVYYVRSINQ